MILTASRNGFHLIKDHKWNLKTQPCYVTAIRSSLRITLLPFALLCLTFRPFASLRFTSLRLGIHTMHHIDVTSRYLFLVQLTSDHQPDSRVSSVYVRI